MNARISVLAICMMGMLTPALHAVEPPKAKVIDLVICLDTSNSMDGLIASAKSKLWDIVNDLARVQPTPELRVALYSYGNLTYDAASGWVRKDLDLTTDLDEVYRKLNGLTTRGGEEYVARVCRDALRDLKWHTDPGALRIVFVCGNEPASQDKQLTLSDIAESAKRQGVVINPIFCGPPNHSHAADWKQLASDAGGRFASIDQDRSAAIATPFDKDLNDLGAKINTTYLCYGHLGQEKAANQVAQDLNAAKVSPASSAARAVSKGGALYKNSEWDLVDRCRDDPKFDITKLTEDELPPEMKKLNAKERIAYVKKKADERAAIQKQIQALNGKRQKFLDDHRKKNPSAAEREFDATVKTTLREQAAAKGITIPN